MAVSLQRAGMWKRISAFLFDAILLGILAVLFAFLFSSILGYDRYVDTLNRAYETYGEKYGGGRTAAVGRSLPGRRTG